MTETARGNCRYGIAMTFDTNEALTRRMNINLMAKNKKNKNKAKRKTEEN